MENPSEIKARFLALAPGSDFPFRDCPRLAIVSVPKLGHTRDALDALFYDHRLKPKLAMELDSSELLKRFVAADVGVGFIARSNIEEDIRAKALVAITLADAQIRRDLAIVFRKDKSLSRAAKAFMDIAVKQKNFSMPVAGDGKRSK